MKYLDYKSNNVCGSSKGSVDWQISEDYINPNIMRKELCFKYYDGLTGNLRASSPPLLVYTDAQLIIDGMFCYQLD